MATKKKAHNSLAEIEKFVMDAGSDHLPTFGGKFEGGIHCQQVPDEIAPCIHTILEFGITVNDYLEIGVAAGGTTAIMNTFFSPGNIVLVDDNQHWKSGRRVDVLADIVRHEVIGNSRSESVVSQVKALADGFDLMIIDGDHTYPGVRGDADLYLPMLRPGGFLILHDSVLPDWGVLQITAELKEDESLEFINEFVSVGHPRPCGVALFRKK